MSIMYYSGTELLADLELVKMIRAFHEDPRFEILEAPKTCIVREMKSVGGPEIGSHTGYEYHYVVVKCLTNGNVYHINKATHYLFEGKWHVTTFVESKGYEQQALYPYEYKDNEDLCNDPPIRFTALDTPKRRIMRNWSYIKDGIA